MLNTTKLFVVLTPHTRETMSPYLPHVDPLFVIISCRIPPTTETIASYPLPHIDLSFVPTVDPIFEYIPDNV